jgi:NADH:ubiquinone oxidoreductase subunit 5 (subunit L)/multisubunit Na+/H+ antiporter MnhA subunit
MMRPQLFSATLLLGLIPITAGLAVLRLLIWGDFLEFISPAHHEGAAALARISLAGWSPASILFGVGVAIAGWATAFYFHIFPAHPSAWWSERKKTLYVFFLNQGYFDQVYGTMIIRPYLRFASWLWQNLDVRLIDRPASGLVNAADKMGTRVAKVFGSDTTVEPGVPYAAMRLLMILLVFLLFLLGVAERIEIYFLA